MTCFPELRVSRAWEASWEKLPVHAEGLEEVRQLYGLNYLGAFQSLLLRFLELTLYFQTVSKSRSILDTERLIEYLKTIDRDHVKEDDTEACWDQPPDADGAAPA